jgi:hypothetical protein
MRIDDTRAARFWARVDRSGGPYACWPWTKARNRDGYGHLRIYDKDWLAHRLAWFLTHGDLAPGLDVCHVVCDNPPCCNPAHLRPQPHHANVLEMVMKGRHGYGGLSALCGEAHRQAKLATSDVIALREAYAAGTPQRALAVRYGVSQSRVSLIVRRRSWAHVP